MARTPPEETAGAFIAFMSRAVCLQIPGCKGTVSRLVAERLGTNLQGAHVFMVSWMWGLPAFERFADRVVENETKDALSEGTPMQEILDYLPGTKSGLLDKRRKIVTKLQRQIGAQKLAQEFVPGVPREVAEFVISRELAIKLRAARKFKRAQSLREKQRDLQIALRTFALVNPILRGTFEPERPIPADPRFEVR